MLSPTFLETESGSVVGARGRTGTDCKWAQGKFGGGLRVQTLDCGDDGSRVPSPGPSVLLLSTDVLFSMVSYLTSLQFLHQ